MASGTRDKAIKLKLLKEFSVPGSTAFNHSIDQHSRLTAQRTGRIQHMSGNAILSHSDHSDAATYCSAPLCRPPNIALGHLDHSDTATFWSAPPTHPPFNAVMGREHIHARRQILIPPTRTFRPRYMAPSS